MKPEATLQTNWSHTLLDTRPAYNEAVAREVALLKLLDRLNGVADRVVEKRARVEEELRDLQTALYDCKAARKAGW